MVSETVYIFNRENAIEQREISGSSVKRIDEVMKLIKAGKKVDFNKIYNTKKYQS